MAFLDIDHVSKYFPDPSGQGRVCVFNDVTVKIDKGEFVTVIGHSGCGKSTLLNIVPDWRPRRKAASCWPAAKSSGPVWIAWSCSRISR